jgi:hypothetical protein
MEEEKLKLEKKILTDKLIQNQTNRCSFQHLTIDQSDSELWKELRISLLTASNLGKI